MSFIGIVELCWNENHEVSAHGSTGIYKTIINFVVSLGELYRNGSTD